MNTDVFFENPMTYVVFGVLAEAGLGALLVVTRRSKILWAMVGVALLTAGGLIAERLVVTKREQVVLALDAICRAVESNDSKKVQACISANPASSILKRVDFYMTLADFESVRLHGLKVDVNRLASPPSAQATFDGTVRYKDKTGLNPYSFWSGSFVLQLVQEKGEWKVKDARGDPLRPNEGGP